MNNDPYREIERAQRKGKLIVTLIIVFVMLCSFVPAILFGYAFIENKQREKRCTRQVKAEVVRNVSETRTETDDDDHTETYTAYAPVYSFVVSDDIPHEVTGSFDRNKPKYNEGDKVELYINPDDLTEYWEPGSNKWGIPAILFSLLLPAFNIGIILIIRKMIKNNKTAHPAAEER